MSLQSGRTIDFDGLRNYITNSNFEINATGYNAFADAASATPTDGTGGSPNVTIVRSTSSPLVDTASGLFTKDAANRQGQGFSFDFTIDSAYQSTPFTIGFAYKIASGIYSSGDLTVWIYDITNATIIQPAGGSILNATVAQQQTCSFQTSSNSTSYRLIFYCGSTSASAYAVQFDQIFVSPNTYNSGGAVTDWISYTPTFTAMGTPTSVAFAWRRVGGNIEIEGKFNCGSPSASQARVSLPSGLVASTNTNDGPAFRGAGNLYQGQNGATTAYVLAEGGFSYMTFGIQGSSNTGLTQANGTTVFANTVVYTMSATFPIAGWGTSQVLSSDTDTRVVAARVYFSGANYSYTANTAIQYNTVTYDTHGSFASNTYTIPVAGRYRFSTSFLQTGAGTSAVVYLSKNGGASDVANYLNGASNTPSSASITVDAVAGDAFTIRMDTAIASFYPGGLSIERISGPAQIAASENVRASYYDSSVTKTPGTDTQYNFDTKVYDTHGAVTTGASWKFSAPISGNYQIGAHAYWNSGGSGGALQLFKNGSLLRYLTTIYGNASGTNLFAVGSTTVYLLAGDYIDVRPSSGATFTGGAVQTYVDIFRQGN